MLPLWVHVNQDKTCSADTPEEWYPHHCLLHVHLHRCLQNKSLYCDIGKVCGLGRGKDRIEMDIYSLALNLAVGKIGSFSLMTMGF